MLVGPLARTKPIAYKKYVLTNAMTLPVDDAFLRPRLRSIEPFVIESGDGRTIGIRDRSGLSQAVIGVSPGALYLMSLFDGQRTCDEILSEFRVRNGVSIEHETLQTLLRKLDEVRFLEGPSFDAHYEALVSEYRRGGRRPPRSTLNLASDGGGCFDSMLDGAGEVGRTHRPAGLIVPHLDYPRGAPCYAAGYATLKHFSAPARVVVLGTNHFGRSAGPVATRCDFETPMGVTPTDGAFVEALERRFGNLLHHELDHLNEHSVELQVAWLQYLFGAASFQLVPILCPDVCGPFGESVEEFALALRDLLAESGSETLVIAGADFSHVGAAFGDERMLDADFLAEVAARDQAALGRLAAGDAEGFRDLVGRDDNPTRVCSAGCMFVLIKALGTPSIEILGYHQAVDVETQTCVTCAAVAFA